MGKCKRANCSHSDDESMRLHATAYASEVLPVRGIETQQTRLNTAVLALEHGFQVTFGPRVIVHKLKSPVYVQTC